MRQWRSRGKAGALDRSPAKLELMIIYGLGYATVYLVFVLLYWNALRQRADLGFEPLRSLRHLHHA